MTFCANDTKQKARKDHVCCACGEKIPKGFIYARSFFVDDGSYSDKWHVECRGEFLNMLREYGEYEGDPYSTWENGLPNELKRKYGIELEVEENA